MRKKIFLGVMSAIVSFLVLDQFLYRLVPQTCIINQPDRLLHHSLVPNRVCRATNDEFDVEYRVNSLGLRDVEFPEKKSETEKRILFMGDSFTEGSGVSLGDTMVKQSQELLKQVVKESDILAINAGFGAYSPLLESLYLQYRGINLDPDLVVVNLFMNDFNDDRSYLQKAHFGPDGQVESVYVELKQHFPTWLIRYLDGRSFSYYVFKQQERRLWKLKGKFVAWIRRQSPPDYAKTGVEFDPGNPDRDPFAITRDIPQETFADLFRPTGAILQQIKQYLDQRGIPLIVVVIPAGHQVGSTQWVSGRLSMHLTESLFSDRIIEEFAAFSQESGVTVLDLTSGLRAYLHNHQDAKLYFDSDGHFTPLGQQVAAELFVEFVSRQSVLAKRLRL